MRTLRASGREVPARLTKELVTILTADQENQGSGNPIDAAIELLELDLDKFLETYFVVSEDRVSKGYHSFTSR
jgi:hypothetical protein